MNNQISTVAKDAHWQGIYRDASIRTAEHAMMVGLLGEYLGKWTLQAFWNTIGSILDGFDAQQVEITSEDGSVVTGTLWSPSDTTLIPLTTVFCAVSEMWDDVDVDPMLEETQAGANKLIGAIDDLSKQFFGTSKVAWSTVRRVGQSTAFTGWAFDDDGNCIVEAKQVVETIQKAIEAGRAVTAKNFDGGNQKAWTLAALEDAGVPLNDDEQAFVADKRKSGDEEVVERDKDHKFLVAFEVIAGLCDDINQADKPLAMIAEAQRLLPKLQTLATTEITVDETVQAN